MRRWGMAITAFYALVLIVLLYPLGGSLWEESYGDMLAALIDPYSLGEGAILVWVIIAIFVGAQAMLLFVSVDVSRKRLKPRRHVAISVAVTTFAVGVMTISIVLNIVAVLASDDIFDWWWPWFVVPVVCWLAWGIVFYLYRQQVSERINRTVGWLLNGSVLQLLVAVPTHIYIRQRDDCSAPLVSGYGIATGIALMLMAFGPSVLFLYQKRLSEYGGRESMPLLAKWPARTLGGAVLATLLALIFFAPGEPLATRVVAFEGRSSDMTAMRSDISRIASEFGMTTDRGVTMILCNDRTVARIRYPGFFQQTQLRRWSYEIYGGEFAKRDEYARFEAAMESVHGELESSETGIAWTSAQPLWLARVWSAPWFSGCRLPE